MDCNIYLLYTRCAHDNLNKSPSLLQDGLAGKKHLHPTINQFFCHWFWLWRGVTGFGFYTIQYNAIQYNFAVIGSVLWRGVTGFGFYTIQYNAIQYNFSVIGSALGRGENGSGFSSIFVQLQPCFNITTSKGHSFAICIIVPSHIKL